MPDMPLTQTRLDELWDFSDAPASEQRLRRAAEAARGAERAELLTQVARALGLQERFAEADAVLDDVAAGPDADDAAVRARTALERGRVRNSAGDAAAAVPLFAEAERTAAAAGLTFLQVDALHMIAIASPDGAGATDAALAVLEGVTDERTLRWRVGLHNNRGWAFFDAERYEEALASFVASRDAAERWGTPQQVQWADEAIAETVQHLA
jgi:tetratricopeptide (TPR) repeat protein